MLDALLGGLTYWMIGWGAAYGKGGNGFIGGSNYFSYNMDAMDYPAWFFQFVFAETPSCTQERENALREESKDPNGGIFVPDCAPNGNFRQVKIL